MGKAGLNLTFFGLLPCPTTVELQPLQMGSCSLYSTTACQGKHNNINNFITAEKPHRPNSEGRLPNLRPPASSFGANHWNIAGAWL